MTTNNGKMIGRSKIMGFGPGGHKCECCGDAPGKARKVSKRAARRKERRIWEAEIAD